MTDAPNDEVDMAIAELLVGNRSGDLVEDLCQAARESMRRRAANSHNGGVVIAALREHGLSWREIERRTTIPSATARRWAEPPATAGDDQ